MNNVQEDRCMSHNSFLRRANECKELPGRSQGTLTPIWYPSRETRRVVRNLQVLLRSNNTSKRIKETLHDDWQIKYSFLHFEHLEHLGHLRLLACSVHPVNFRQDNPEKEGSDGAQGKETGSRFLHSAMLCLCLPTHPPEPWAFHQVWHMTSCRLCPSYGVGTGDFMHPVPSPSEDSCLLRKSNRECEAATARTLSLKRTQKWSPCAANGVR